MPAGYYNKNGLPIRSGKMPWNKGLTIETDERVKINIERATETIREQYRNGREGSRLGSKATEETRTKLRISHLGKHLPEAQKKAIGDANRGKKKPPRSKEHKLNLSLNHARLSGKDHPMWGKRGEKNPNFGRKLSSEQIKKSLRRRIPSSLEKKFQTIINKYNLLYKFVGDGSFIIGNCNPDFINTNSEKIAVEVYARFYKQLGGKSIEEWKRKRTEIFRQYGWEVIYFDETQIEEKYVLGRLRSTSLLKRS